MNVLICTALNVLISIFHIALQFYRNESIFSLYFLSPCNFFSWVWLMLLSGFVVVLLHFYRQCSVPSDQNKPIGDGEIPLVFIFCISS